MGYDLSRIPAVAASLSVPYHECLVTLALKITDDSCKMDDYERAVFMRLYDALPAYAGTLFDASAAELIAIGRSDPSAFVFGEIRKLRTHGMDTLGRDAMKAFKAEMRRLLSI